MTITLDRETEKTLTAHPELALEVAEFAKQRAMLFQIRSKRSSEVRKIANESARLAGADTRSREELFEEMNRLIDNEISPDLKDSSDGD